MDYTMYKFFKGEKSNPYDNETDSALAKFWFYESLFDIDFKNKRTFEWHSFFADHDLDSDFMKVLSEDDYEKLTEKTKKPVFELWLTYLFKYKLYPEYGGENTDKKLYYSTGL